jgi:hypothetical protein
MPPNSKGMVPAFLSGYHQHIGRRPLVETGALGAAGAGLGYFGSRLALPYLVNALLAGKSQEEQEEAWRELQEDGTLGMLSGASGVVGGLLGAGYGLQKHLDVGGGISGALSSMTDPEYYKRPEVVERMQALAKERMRRVRTTDRSLTTPYTSGRSGAKMLEVQASFEDGLLFDKERVPISTSIDLINKDPFLTLPQKKVTDLVLTGSGEGSSGLTSGKNLMRSAVQLGVGAGTGYIFGRAASALLSLPPPVTKRLSGAGAIAGALVNSGLFSEIDL